MLIKRIKVACIGSRQAPYDAIQIMENIGKTVVSSGFYVASGNAVGSDQAYARGANTVDPSKVLLYLPWLTYEKQSIHPQNMVITEPIDEWEELAAKHHPRYWQLSQGAQKMMKRNVGIILSSATVFAYMNPNKSHGGGTSHSVRIAEYLGIPVVRLDKPEEAEGALDFVMKIGIK